ncbi:MAG: hypothetical protein GX595_12765 [Lentisphaerae bacterium]|nr:hypothetical protein [Lentisphaerota bacterium]
MILLALGGPVVVWRLALPPSPDDGGAGAIGADTGSEVRPSARRAPSLPAGRDRDPRGRLRPRRPGPARGRTAATAAADDAPADTGDADPAVDPRERALRQWDALIEKACQAETPALPVLADRVKAAFDRLDQDDRLDGVQAAVNALPDASFPVLYGVLFDREQDPEVLDAIFSDALNRPDELKNPVLQRLRADRRHPLFFESARILDVIGEPADAAPAAPTDGTAAP